MSTAPLKGYKSGGLAIPSQGLGVTLYYSLRLMEFNRDGIGNGSEECRDITELNSAPLFGFLWPSI